MPIEQSKDRFSLIHNKGPTIELLWFGAHIISWTTGTKTNPTPTDRIFTSSKSPLDGSVPVRGGIPIVFPAFAYPSHPDHLKMGVHGFARNEFWKWDGNLVDNESEISVRLTLDPVPSIEAVWDKCFHLDYVITLKEFSLTTTLHVTNTSTSIPFDFQSLFHTYHACPSKDVRINPLKGIIWFDKTQLTDGQPTKKVENREDGVDVLEWTDAVFEATPSSYELVWPGGRVDVKTSGMRDMVIWNPREVAGRKIPEMEEGGWDKFVCVEPGIARTFETLQPGATWVGVQEMSVR
ncbi:galactose mutarotase-like protein [Hymenopellis radicata]|nr:galactose mutarotase-like protein [Hymenopellis radicata]